MNVAIECSTFIFGGFERFLTVLLGVLAEEGVRARLIAWEEGPVAHRYRALGVPLDVFPRRDREGRQQLTESLQRWGVQLAQSHSFDPSFAMAARQAGCRNVWRLKGHVRLSCPDDEDQADRMLALGSALADRIVCPSHFLADQFGDQARVIPNGVDLDFIDRETERLQGRPTRPLVATVGHLVPCKHHEIFLQAAGRLRHRFPDHRFAVYGQPSEDFDYAERLKAMLEPLGLPASTLPGPFQGSFVEALQPLEVAVFPFIDEGFANAAVEAMAVGKPVVAARSGVLAEHIEHEVDGLLVEPRDPDAMAEGIARLLEDPALARRLGQAARAKARRLWDPRQCARRYGELYRELLDG